MVNEINIPKENKAQIVEIREMENKIPTYEEFMKTYNENEEVVESYKSKIETQEKIRNDKENKKHWASLATEFIPIPGAGLAVDSFIDNMDNADLNPTSSIVLAALGVETNNRVTYSQIVEKYNEIKDWYYTVRNR